jgi:hypothetical protein
VVTSSGKTGKKQTSHNHDGNQTEYVLYKTRQGTGRAELFVSKKNKGRDEDRSVVEFVLSWCKALGSSSIAGKEGRKRERERRREEGRKERLNKSFRA